MFDNKSVLVTGGTGTIGSAFVKRILDTQSDYKSLIVLSRDEIKQVEVRRRFPKHIYPKLKLRIGDIRDKEKVLVETRDVDIIIHTAAMKLIEVCEENPEECHLTNVTGTSNIIEAAILNQVSKTVFISSDKACTPTTVYGISKKEGERLVINANDHPENSGSVFYAIRAGNVLGSRGSVLEIFKGQKETRRLTITDPEMTRFNILAEEVVDCIEYAISNGSGKEIFVPKMSSFRISDLAEAVVSDSEFVRIGFRKGEKFHEEVISSIEASHTLESDKMYILIPHQDDPNKWGGYQKKHKALPVEIGFRYSSDTNNKWETIESLKNKISCL